MQLPLQRHRCCNPRVFGCFLTRSTQEPFPLGLPSAAVMKPCSADEVQFALHCSFFSVRLLPPVRTGLGAFCAANQAGDMLEGPVLGES